MGAAGLPVHAARLLLKRIHQDSCRCELSLLHGSSSILLQVRFAAAQCSLTILRYITDHAPHLSLSVLARVVSRL